MRRVAMTKLFPLSNEFFVVSRRRDSLVKSPSYVCAIVNLKSTEMVKYIEIF
jgi:hypothetical protein